MDRESLTTLALSALLLWAPLPYGSVTPAAEMLFRVVAFGVFVLALATGWRPRLRSGGLALAALAAIALLGLAQACSWPAAVTAAVSPEHARLYRGAAAMVPELAAPSSIPLTLAASLSRSSALSWLAAAALLAAAMVAGRRARHRRWLFKALVAAALIQVAIGLWSLWRSSPAGLALLLRPGGRIRGTFTNPNHLALLLEMTMAPVAAWGWYELTRSRGSEARRLLQSAVPLLLWLVLLVGVAFTGSRSGLVAALFGFAVQALFMPMAGRRRRAWLPVMVFLLGARDVGDYRDAVRDPALRKCWRLPTITYGVAS